MKSIVCKAALLGALAFPGSSPAADEDYVFIVPGTYPADNPSHSDDSSSAPLVFGSLDGVSVSGTLEVRNCTVDGSAGIALRSDKFRALYIVIR
jgi:hypothetical protein